MKKKSKKKAKKKVTKESSKNNKKKIGGFSVEVTILKKAPKKHEFMLHDGRIIKDLRELAFAFADMDESVFWHHVNDSKNDFSIWINDVIKDKELAESLKQIKNKFDAHVHVLRHIVNKI